MSNNGGSAILVLNLPVGQRACQARDKHKELSGIAEAIVAEGQPAADIVRHVVEENEPQRNAAARIDPEIAASQF